MSLHTPLSPDDSGFYSRPSEALARDLPGHVFVTEAGRQMIAVAEGFSGLPRKGMVADYERMDRKPGDICVTNFRGWPQLNVVGADARTGEPQLTWLKSMETIPGADEIKNAGVVAAIMEMRGATGKAVEFAIEVLDGSNVQDPSSPLAVMRNDDANLGGRKRVFVGHSSEGAAGNSVGIGMLSHLEPRALPEMLRDMLTEAATKSGVTFDQLVSDPTVFGKVIADSPHLQELIEKLQKQQR